jgi:hypothetical protein
MGEEHQSTLTSDHPYLATIETKTTNNHSKKSDSQKENPLYSEPVPKCYIGNGNNSEL